MSDTQVKPPFLRTPYNYDRDKASNDHGLECLDPTLTQQQFKDECNINVLFAKYLETGEMPQVTDGIAYGDFTGIFDFQTAQNAVRTAEGMFQQLPARIKNRFDNDPQKLLDFLAIDENREEAEFLGIVKKPENMGTGGTTVPVGQPQGTQPAPTPTTPASNTSGTSPAA